MSEQALVVTSFGTSVPEARRSISAVEEALAGGCGRHGRLLLHRPGRITPGAGDVSGTSGETALSGENQRDGGV